MSRRLLAAELRLMFREGAVRTVLLGAVALAALAAYNGRAWDTRQRETTAAVRALDAERRDQHVRDLVAYRDGTFDPEFNPPGDAYAIYAWTAQFTASPPPPLRYLAVGQTDILPFYAMASGATPNQLFHGEEIQHPFTVALGRFDPAFFLIVVLPLLAIALSFDIVTRDGEAGRVPMLLSASGSIGRVAVRRAAVRWVVLCIAAIVPTVLAAPRASDAAGALLGVASLVSLHVAFWFALTLAISRTNLSSVRTGVALISTWAVLVLVVPGLVDAIAKAREPIASGLARPIEDRRPLESFDEADAWRDLARLEPELVAGANPDDLAREAAWAARFETTRAALHEDRALLRAAVHRRQRIADLLAFASPPLLLRGLLERAAASHTAALLAYQSDHDAYMDRWAAATRGFVIQGVLLSPEEVAALPRFEPRAQSSSALAASVAAGWTAAASLMLVLIGLRELRRRS